MTARASLWLLASAGVLVGHAVGYAAVHPGGAVAGASHGYLGPLGAVLVPAGLVAVVATAVRTVRRMGAAPSLPLLATAQVAMFTAQELLERVPGEGSPLDALHEPAVWIGLVAQVVVAWATLRLVGIVVRAARAVAAGSRPRATATPRLVLAVPASGEPGRPAVTHLPGRRGPPRLAGAALTS